ncbi:hypothetical protein HQQ94_07270 [Shewanella sp. VB17]|uniref:cohesin domain-containing protein n=1 Tax=Shewanella sp. VB17 TaxID=2739432 RepID=UPI001567C23F|nr:cohesin domain-containing protein [Shewanella sp. VB17]NRD73043.1 hypothetical protein [Shewanella sp. VB17]
MKNRYLTKLCSILLLLIYCLPVIASEGQVYLSTPSQQIKTGSEFYLDVLVSGAPDVYGVQFEIAYTANMFSLIDSHDDKAGLQISDGHFFDTDNFFTLNNTADTNTGVINYVVSQVSPAKDVNGHGQIARLFFTSSDKAGAGTIVINSAEFGTRDGQSVDLALGPAISLDFKANYQVPAKPSSTELNQQTMQLISKVLAILFVIGMVMRTVLMRRKKSLQAKAI